MAVAMAATVFPVVASAADVAPVITEQPLNAIASTGATVRFTAAATGSPTPTVKWRQVTCTLFCGTATDVPGATTTALAVTAPAATTRYFAVFTNAAGSVSTNFVGVTYRSAPVVSTTSTTVDYAVGDSKELSATVTSGTPTPTVQWQESTDGGTTWTAIAGAETTNYTLGPLTAAFSGRKYRMVATNSVGSATSGITTLAGSTAPVITAQPQNTAAQYNSSASFTVNATGSPTPTTTWQRSLDGGATWTTASTATTMPSTYTTTVFSGVTSILVRAVVANAGGSVTSDVATLTAGTLPSFANFAVTPSGQLALGATATLAFGSITASPAPTYQWQRKRSGESVFTDIAGATSSSLTTVVSALDVGATYQLVATNLFGTVTANAGSLAILAAPTISVQPTDQTTAVGTFATFSLTSTGSPQWQLSTDGGATWANVAFGTNASLFVTPSSVAQDGSLYRVVSTNNSGSVTSNVVRLTVNPAPDVLSNPADQTVAVGQTATFTATATAPVATATWQRSTDGGTNWSTVSGGTLTTAAGVSTATLSVASTTSSLNGFRYRVTFNRSPGVATTQAAILTVTGTPVISSQVTSRTILAGTSTTFTASATSNGTPTVAWERSNDAGVTWTPVAGGTTTQSVGTLNASLVVGPTTVADDGARFRATVTNASGSVVSSVGTLSVLAVTSSPSDVTVTGGSTATFTASSNLAAATVRWEVMTPAATFYSTVSGATSPTYSVAATAAMTGNLYRAVFTSGTVSTTTAAARLYVSSAAPAISVNAVGGAATVGTVLNLTSVAVGSPAPVGGWESSVDGGTTWTPLTAGSASSSTATETTLTLAFTVPQVASTQIRSVFTNDGGTTRSTATGVAGLYPLANPTDTVAQAGVTATFSASGANAGYPTWEVSTDGGATFTSGTGGVGSANTLSLVPTAAMNGYQYRAKFTASAFPNPVFYSSPATLTVNTAVPPTIVSFSDNQLTNRRFTVVAASAAQPTVTWERSTDSGSTWQTVATTTSTWTEPRLTTTLDVAMSLATSGSYRASISNAYGTVRSTVVSFQTDFGPNLTSQPQDVTVATGGTATYTVGIAASPAPHSYYWETSANGGLTWSDLLNPSVSPLVQGCGQNSCTLKATQSSPHLLVRVRAVSLNGSVTSSTARLDVTGPPVSSIAELTWPVSTGTPVKLIRQAYSGSPVTSVAWERSGDRGATWSPVAGGTVQQLQTTSEFRAELTITPTIADNDARYRATFTNQYGATTTAALTVDTNAPVITQQPVGVTRTSPGTATFTVAGAFYTSVTWQRSNDGGTTWATISGATSATYSFNAVVADSGASFRARLTSSTGTTTSAAATLLVQSAPVVQTNPLGASVAAGTPITLTAAATGLPAPTLQWQRSTDQGATWTAEPGATTGSLSFVASVALDGVRFRVVFTNVAGTATSSAATINVTAVAQTLQFDPAPPASAVVGATFPVGVTASSGLVPVVSVAGPCTSAGGTVTTTGAGSCVVSATQAGDATYAAAPPLSAIVAVAKQAQTITVTPLPAVPVTGSTAVLVASSSSGLPVALAATGGCTLTGSTVEFVTAGALCTVTASQAGDAAFDAATDVALTTVAKSTQSISGFANLPVAPVVGTSFDVAATASSGLPVAFSASGSCSIVDRTVTVNSAGTCTVTASQAGDDAWFPAEPIALTTSPLTGQTLQFDPAPPSSVAVRGTFPVGVLSSSGLTPVVTVTGPCTFAAGSVTATGVGSCVVSATQAGDATYAAAPPISAVVAVSKATQTITVTALPAVPVTGSTAVLVASSSSGLPVALAATGGCTLTGSTVRFVTAGAVCTVRASQAGDAAFEAAADVVLTTVAKSTQSISGFANLPVAPAIGASFGVTATASSGLPVAFSASGSCSIVDRTVTVNSAGTCTVTASQAGDGARFPAVPIAKTTIAPADQTITFAPLPTAPAVGSSIGIKTLASASSGLAIVVAVSGGGCTVSGPTVKLTAAGVPCNVTVSQPGSAMFRPAPPVTQTTTAVSGPQTITFASLPTGLVPGSTFGVTATATSKLPVTFAASGACATDGVTVTITGSGTCTVRASQAGDVNYLPAVDVVRTTIVKADQTITFLPLPIAPQVGTKLAVNTVATATSGQTLTITVSGGCTVSAAVLTFTVAGQTCTVTVSQKGSTLYNPAAPVSQSTTPVPGAQRITFNSLPTGLVAGSTVTMVASASSALPVSLVATGACAATGTILTITGTGLCTVTAQQAGDANYLPAVDVVRTTIVKSDQAITFAPLPAGPAAGSNVTIAASSSAGLVVKLTAVGCTLSGNKLTFLAAGTVCTVTATQAGSTSVNPAVAVVRTTTSV